MSWSLPPGGTVVVVGASLAGAHAATALRRGGFDGRLVVVGAEPHLPYDRPPLSKAFLAGAGAPGARPSRGGDETAPALPAAVELDGAGVEWHLGDPATSLDLGRRTLTLSTGTELPFDGLVVATGCAPRTLRGAAGLAGVHVLRTLDDARALRADLEARPRRVVVVGAGFIGLEVAATCRDRGLEVTVVDVVATPLEAALGPEVGSVVAAVHRDHGVDLRLGVGVEGFDGSVAASPAGEGSRPAGEGSRPAVASPEGSAAWPVGGRVERVRLADGTAVDADVVVLGLGVTPVTGWLEGSGLVLDDGVVCDPTCLAAPGVVAAGDVARFPNGAFGGQLMRVEHWEHAVEMGGYAGRRLLAGGSGPVDPFAPVPWFWSDQYDRKLQLAGRPAAGDQLEVVAGSFEERRFAATYGRDGRVVAVVGLNRPRQVVLGRALVARGASVDEARAALAG